MYSTRWDPLLIIAQIICVQSFFYIALVPIMFVMDAGIGKTVTMAQIFDPSLIRLTTPSGLVATFAFLLTSAAW